MYISNRLFKIKQSNEYSELKEKEPEFPKEVS